MRAHLRLVFVAVVLIPSVAAAQGQLAQAEGTGIVYSDSSAIIVSAPKGWVLDADRTNHNGLPAVFYRIGESWEHGVAVMYVNPAQAGVTLDSVMARDAADIRAQRADLQIESPPAVRVEHGDSTRVRLFSSDANGNFDAVAYFQSADRVWLIVLSARDRASRDAALPAFRSLVESCLPARVEHKAG